MKNPLSIGLSFGLTSGVITTLGVIVGLNASTHSKAAVIGGILTVALADSFSDALGMHAAEESLKDVSQKFTWQTTISTFFSKLFFAISFVAPFIFLPYFSAIITSIIWGISVITIFSYILAKRRKESVFHAVFEHVSIGALVILLTQFLGMGIEAAFK